jgi:hypothetical protein
MRLETKQDELDLTLVLAMYKRAKIDMTLAEGLELLKARRITGKLALIKGASLPCSHRSRLHYLPRREHGN